MSGMQTAVRNRCGSKSRLRIRHLMFVIVLLALGVLLVGCADDTTIGPIMASGFLEGEEVTVASEVSDRIADMLVDRGDAVAVGDMLVRLDDAVLQSQRLEAEAGLATARANLARVLAGPRSAEVTAARAVLAQREVERQGAAQAVINAADVISRPLSLDAEIVAARTQVQLAEQNVEMQEANLAETELKYDVYAKQGGDVKRGWDLQLRASRESLAQAQAELGGAQSYLNALWAIRANPLALEAQLHAAETQHRIAEARVFSAKAALDELEAGPTEQQIAFAEAQVRQADAAVRLIDAQISQLTLTAPIEGIVTARSGRAGESATAGGPLLTIANLENVTLDVYIPENRIGLLQVGQEVRVQVDSYPARAFIGHVARIADEAEFTPRNVQTQEERVNLVFAVTVRIPNPSRALKPGMPADATFKSSD